MIVLPGLPQLVDRAVQEGVAEVAGDFGEGFEDEVAIVEIGMRDGEVLVVDMVWTVKEQIEVDAPRSLVDGAAPAHGRFDVEHVLEQVSGGEGGLEVEAGVEEGRLVLDKAGRGLVNGAAGLDANPLELLEGADGLVDGMTARPDIGAQPNIGIDPGWR